MFNTYQFPSARLLKESNTLQIFLDAHAATGTLLRTSKTPNKWADSIHLSLSLKYQTSNLTNHQADKIPGLLASAEHKLDGLQVASNLS